MILGLLACVAEECDLGDDGLGSPTAWEQAVLEAGLPASPEPAFVEAEDGLMLAVRDWVPDGWDGTGTVLVLIPGSSAHAAEYSPLAAGLADRGVFVRGIDVRGHGLSIEGPRAPEDDGVYVVGRAGDSTDPQQMVRDLSLHVAAVRRLFPEAQVTVAGHSSGGGVVSRWVESGGAAQADRFVLLAPYNHHDQPQVRPSARLDCAGLSGTAYARLDEGALGDALRGNVHRYVLTFHKPPAYTDPLDVLAYTWTTVQGMATSDPTGFWPLYTAPLLVVAASEDALLDPEITRQQAAQAPDSTFVEVADTSHVGLAWSDEVAEIVAGFTRGGG